MSNSSSLVLLLGMSKTIVFASIVNLRISGLEVPKVLNVPPLERDAFGANHSKSVSLGFLFGKTVSIDLILPFSSRINFTSWQ